MKKIEVDVEQFARDIKAGKGIGGTDGALSFLIKQLTELKGTGYFKFKQRILGLYRYFFEYIFFLILLLK